MIKTAIIYLIIDKCLDILDMRISDSFGLLPPNKPVIELNDGDLVLCYRNDIPIVMGQSNGKTTHTHFELEVWDEMGESWELRKYAFNDFDELEIIADEDLVDEDDLDEDDLEALEEIEGGIFPVRG